MLAAEKNKADIFCSGVVVGVTFFHAIATEELSFYMVNYRYIQIK